MGSLEKHIIISSEDKDLSCSTSNSDFVVNLAETYYTQNILKVLVAEATIPNVFPNIRGSEYGTSQNNVLNFNDGVARSITLPEGQYLINSVNPLIDFTSNLQTAINAVSTSTLSVTYNELTNKLVFEVTAGGAVTIFASSPMADVLGITSDLVIPLLTPTSAQAQVDLSGYQNVYIHSKEVALSHAIDGDTGLISVVTPVSLADAPFGGYAYRQNNDDELASVQYDQVRNLSRISIVLRDNLGNKLDIGSHKMNVVLKCYLDSG